MDDGGCGKDLKDILEGIPPLPLSKVTPIQRNEDDATLVIAAVALAFLLTIFNAGEAVLQTAATPFVALFFLFLLRFPLRYASR